MERNCPSVEFEHDDFEWATLEEELRVNERCQSLLGSFHEFLLSKEETPQHASDLTFCVDMYLRDYLLDFARLNVVCPRPGVVRRFAGNWFITHTLDPDIKVLERHLLAIAEFYRFLREQHFISREELRWLEEEAGMIEYYHRRIGSFLALNGDGYDAWQAECPLGE